MLVRSLSDQQQMVQQRSVNQAATSRGSVIGLLRSQSKDYTTPPPNVSSTIVSTSNYNRQQATTSGHPNSQYVPPQLQGQPVRSNRPYFSKPLTQAEEAAAEANKLVQFSPGSFLRSPAVFSNQHGAHVAFMYQCGDLSLTFCVHMQGHTPNAKSPHWIPTCWLQLRRKPVR